MPCLVVPRSSSPGGMHRGIRETRGRGALATSPTLNPEFPYRRVPAFIYPYPPNCNNLGLVGGKGTPAVSIIAGRDTTSSTGSSIDGEHSTSSITSRCAYEQEHRDGSQSLQDGKSILPCVTPLGPDIPPGRPAYSSSVSPNTLNTLIKPPPTPSSHRCCSWWF